MLLSYDNHITAEGIFAILAVSVPAIWVIWRALKKKRAQLGVFINDLSQVLAGFPGLKDIIERELQTNHGSSIKDAVNELRVAVSALDGKFRAYASYANVIGWESNQDGRCIWVSPALQWLLGRSSDEFMWDSWITVVAPEDRETVSEEWKSCILQKRAFILEYSMMHRDGHRVKILAETHLIRDYTGSVRGYVGVVRVISKPDTALSSS